jgi:hypothetical protein
MRYKFIIFILDSLCESLQMKLFCDDKNTANLIDA